MKEQFVTYEIALKLKELGFNEECLAYYHDKSEPYLCRYLDSNNGAFNINCRHVLFDTDCTAPLWQQVISFLKEKGVLVAELWDGWEFGIEDEDFKFISTRELAILKAIELCQKEK